jgi:hypothetical protein
VDAVPNVVSSSSAAFPPFSQFPGMGKNTGQSRLFTFSGMVETSLIVTPLTLKAAIADVIAAPLIAIFTSSAETVLTFGFYKAVYRLLSCANRADDICFDNFGDQAPAVCLVSYLLIDALYVLPVIRIVDKFYRCPVSVRLFHRPSIRKVSGTLIRDTAVKTACCKIFAPLFFARPFVRVAFPVIYARRAVLQPVIGVSQKIFCDGAHGGNLQPAPKRG